MTQRNIISVIGDMENFLDSLLSHTEEENCQHSVSDFLQEYFDKKNERRAASQTAFDTSAATTPTTTNPSSNKELVYRDC